MGNIENRLRRLEETFGMNAEPPPVRPIVVTLSGDLDVADAELAAMRETDERIDRGELRVDWTAADVEYGPDGVGSTRAASYLAALRPTNGTT
jgi:hypothetical protein